MMQEYIMVLCNGVTEQQFNTLLSTHNITLTENFDALDRHYTVEFDEDIKAQVKADPCVYHVAESDAPVKLMAEQSIRVEATGYGGNWGLTRICRRDEWNDNTWYPNEGIYTYYRTGKNVDVYIVDTGARLTHSEFTGRISVIYDHYQSPSSPAYGVDQQGHGTHVASIVAGTKYGVAKEANILVSRVFETGGATLSAIIAGINACLTHHSAKKESGSNNPSIMNLSLGGPAHKIEEQAINNCIDEGIVCVAAAGNDGMNLSAPDYDVMPAEIARAITVGSIDIQDRVSNFSNYGWQIDTFAPGHYITAAGFKADDGEMMLSGTSMAAPHVAGICALYLDGFGMTENNIQVKEVHDWIWNNSTQNTLRLNESVSSAGTANKIVFSDFVVMDDPVPEPTPQPITEISRETVDLMETTIADSQPTVETTYIDTESTMTNNDGSKTVTTIRTFTDITTIITTTTTTTIPETTITYSDGSTEVVLGDAVISSAVEENSTTSTRSEVISTVVIPAPTPEPTPKLKQNKRWWKKSRTWGRERNGAFAYHQLRWLERMYDQIDRNSDIEELFSQFEDVAEELAHSKNFQRIEAAYKFLDLHEKITCLIRHR